MQEICPNCKHTFEGTTPRKGVRICSACGNGIGRHDKWFFNAEGKVQHRHCEHPEYYTHPHRDKITQTIKFISMKWIKASERLPEKYKEVNAKYKGSPISGNFGTTEVFTLYNGSRLSSQNEYIEWLDESTDHPQPDETIKQLADRLSDVAGYIGLFWERERVLFRSGAIAGAAHMNAQMWSDEEVVKFINWQQNQRYKEAGAALDAHGHQDVMDKTWKDWLTQYKQSKGK